MHPTRGVLLDRERDAEPGALGAGAGGEAFPQAAGAGKQIDNGDRRTHAGSV